MMRNRIQLPHRKQICRMKPKTQIHQREGNIKVICYAQKTQQLRQYALLYRVCILAQGEEKAPTIIHSLQKHINLEMTGQLYIRCYDDENEHYTSTLEQTLHEKRHLDPRWKLNELKDE